MIGHQTLNPYQNQFQSLALTSRGHEIRFRTINVLSIADQNIVIDGQPSSEPREQAVVSLGTKSLIFSLIIPFSSTPFWLSFIISRSKVFSSTFECTASSIRIAGAQAQLPRQ